MDCLFGLCLGSPGSPNYVLVVLKPFGTGPACGDALTESFVLSQSFQSSWRRETLNSYAMLKEDII